MAYRAADPGDTPACPRKEGETMHGKQTLIRDDNIRIPSPRQCGPEGRGALPDSISQSVIDGPGEVQRGILQDGLAQQYLAGTEGQIGVLGVAIRMYTDLYPSAANSESTAQESDKQMDPSKNPKEIEYDSYIHLPILSYICAEEMRYDLFLATKIKSHSFHPIDEGMAF